MTDLRALTVRQPWASAIVDGHKPTENRAQGFPKHHRGLLMIHAGAQWSERGLTDPRIVGAYPNDHHPPPLDSDAFSVTRQAGTRGAVIGLADLVDIHPAHGCCAPWGEETYQPANPDERPPGQVTHLTLERPIRLQRPVPTRGALGLWRPDDDLRLEVAHALAELVTWDPTGAQALADQADVRQLHHVLTEAP